MVFNPNTAPREEGMEDIDLDFTAPGAIEVAAPTSEEVAEVAARAEKDNADIAKTRAALDEVYSWDDADAHRRGFN